jgi:hypothetical protein
MGSFSSLVQYFWVRQGAYTAEKHMKGALLGHKLFLAEVASSNKYPSLFAFLSARKKKV